MNLENWKDIKGFEGVYQVSNMGRIKSVQRINSRNVLIEEKILKLFVNHYGYLQCSLQYPKDIPNKYKCTHKTGKVHRLVAESFLHYPLTPEMYVCHKNGIKSDNRVENLYVGNSETNTRDMYLHGQTRLTIKKILDIYNADGTHQSIADKFGTGKSNVTRIKSGQSTIIKSLIQSV